MSKFETSRSTGNSEAFIVAIDKAFEGLPVMHLKDHGECAVMNLEVFETRIVKDILELSGYLSGELK